jgi:hypothetical protein
MTFRHVDSPKYHYGGGLTKKILVFAYFMPQL